MLVLQEKHLELTVTPLNVSALEVTSDLPLLSLGP